jgi:hypothetical protein
MPDIKKSQEKLLAIVRDAVKKDEVLRNQLNMNDKFRFVQEKLRALLSKLENEFAEAVPEAKSSFIESTDETVDIYVYLFNTQGIDMQTWRKLVSPDVFYEYSVNRPIYAEKEHVDKFINTRPTRSQHAYLTIAISKSFILPAKDDQSQDAVGHTLVKIQEGKLKITQVRCFTHNLIEYNLSPSGELSKKEE